MGTKGAYIAPIAHYPEEMEFLLQKNTKMIIIEYDEVAQYALLRILP